MDKHIIINIGRQYGSGGRLIGEKLAKKLGFSYYDKELINIASKESGLGKEFFEEADEKKGHGIFSNLLGIRSNFFPDDFSYNYLSNETLFKIQSDVIRELASQKSCIFVGRCADYILREHPNCINIFITADIKDRKKRILQRMKDLPEDKAEDMLEKTDKKRSSYYNYYTNKLWGVAGSYDLCINSSFMGVDQTVELIYNTVKERFNI
ncbi:cytidylate kinase-like family protein [Paludibacter sp. 221]|uniref:cytidylate kinase-like family protein n=1 Tax=Paludibacter sp. 221 TaxID=2302939 RepID=UPI0013D1FF49|nr:cytidylate kinase-like family protein [Paludibacter sp. 221]NDV47593.1 cytidylate kinase-like family protein [Paludibacter sp. 221]